MKNIVLSRRLPFFFYFIFTVFNLGSDLLAQSEGPGTLTLLRADIRPGSIDPGFDLEIQIREGEYDQIQIQSNLPISDLMIKGIEKNNRLLWIKKSRDNPTQQGFGCWWVDDQKQQIIIRFGPDYLITGERLKIFFGMIPSKNSGMFTLECILSGTNQQKINLPPVPVNNF